jgi:hypothetical protein
MRSMGLVARHAASSLSTHGDRALSGEASRMNQSDTASACAIAGHRAGLAARTASSRKIRSERTGLSQLKALQEMANRCRPSRSDGASFPSAAWL